MAPLKVGIVGAEEKRWTPDQATRAKQKIRSILFQLISYGHPLWTHPVPHKCPYCGYESSTTNICRRCAEIMYVIDHGVTLVSGGCPRGGVDVWAENIAKKLGIPCEIHRPEVNQWENKKEYKDGKIVIKKGYKARNIEIAKACDILFDIEPEILCPKCKGKGCSFCKGKGKVLNWSGGTWTLNYAKKLGKKGYQIVIPLEAKF